MQILKATVLVQQQGPDLVSLETDLPGAVVPRTEPLDLKFTVARYHGASYVQQHFPEVPVEVIDARHPVSPFLKKLS